MNNDRFEDAVFIVNMRIRIVRDTLRLNPPADFFFERSMEDLAFIDQVLAFLAQLLTENEEQTASDSECDYASDAEWQFNQLLTELSTESSPFSDPGGETRRQIALLRATSDDRRKTFEKIGMQAVMTRAEPVVSSVELNSLLGGR